MFAQHIQFRLTHLLIAMAWVAAVVTAAAFVPTTYESDGWPGPLIYGFLLAVVVAVTLVLSACLRRCRLPVLVVAIVICSAFSYRQSTIMKRFRSLEVEVRHIIAYVEQFNRDHDHFPVDLAGYTFLQPDLSAYIQYSPPATERPPWHSATGTVPYMILYHPTKESGFGHGYSPSHGFWYEDD